VLASAVRTPLDAHNVRQSFRMITKAADLHQEWTPRQLQYTFASLLSANDITQKTSRALSATAALRSPNARTGTRSDHHSRKAPKSWTSS